MTNKQHIVLNDLPQKDNELLIGGHSVSEFSQQTDFKPCYVYDLDATESHINALRQILPAGIKIHYAVKANPHPEIVKKMLTLTDGLDVSSIGEINRVFMAGADPDNIGFSGPGKSQSDINSAVSTGITIHLESKSEFQRVLAASQSSGKQAKVAIRINPDFELKSSGLKMSGGANPFGVDEELAPELINTIQQSDVDFRGFHVFTGSQNLNTENIIQAQDKTIKLMIRLSEIAGGIPDLINIGGGFGIPYFAGDSALDIQAISNNLTKNLSLLRQHRDDSQITLELGRYLIGASGYYICQVIEKKISRKKTFIVVNGGMHHHLAASGNLGQIIRKNYPICVGNNLTSDKTEKVTIVGPLCTPLDILADEIELPVINEGDSIVVFQSGAYGFSASPQLFLSHIAPKELIIGNGAIYV